MSELLADDQNAPVIMVSCSSCGSESPSGMAFCGHCGRRLDAAAEPSHAGERRHITVMFCDLVGSTQLAERLEVEDLRDVLGRYQAVGVAAVEAFGGHVSKYIGDGLLAYFGYPHAHEDDPRRAALAGLRLVAGMAELNAALHEEFGVELHVRVGIHTGFVVAGEMGAGSTREQFAIVGETPNIASRLEGIADPDTVVISGVTQALVEAHVTTEKFDAGELRGVSREIDAFRVLGVRDPGPSRADPLIPFVGRRAEIDRLTELWQRTSHGHGAVAVVEGEAGIGKSRLLEAWCDTVRATGGTPLVLYCSEYQQGSTLYPVVRHMEVWLKLATASADEQMSRLLELVASGDLRPRALPILASLLSIDESLGWSPPPGNPITVRGETLDVLETLLVSSASATPVAVVVEDAQWADPTTLDLLSRLVSRVAAIPVMIVATARTGFELPWSCDLRLELQPLSATDVRVMVGAAAAGDADAPSLAQRVAESAGGVPLYVEELLRTRMLDSDGRGERGPKIPPTLRGLLTSRLDALDSDRPVAQVAAVLGMDVSPDLLGRVVDLERDELADALSRLVSAGVLRTTPGSGYRFSHGLLRDAAYDSLLRRQRRSYHREIAEAIVRYEHQLAERRPELIALHFVQAELPHLAVPHWDAAGAIALRNAAFVEAAEHFANGIRSADLWGEADDGDLIDMLAHRAASLQAAYGYAIHDVDPVYDRAQGLCEASGDQGRLASVIRGRWMAHLLRAEYDTAAELGERMLELGRSRDDDEVLLEGHLYLGLVHLYLGNLQTSRTHLEQAAENYVPPQRPTPLYETLGDSGVGANAYLAPVLNLLGLLDEARRRSDASLELADAQSSPMTLAQAWGMRTLYHLGRNEFEDAAHWVRRTSELSQDRSLSYWRHLSSVVTGWLQARTGHPEDGLAQVETGLAGYISSGSRLGLPYLWMLLVDLYADRGDVDLGLKVIDDAERHISETGEQYAHVAVLRSKARLLMALEPPDRGGAVTALTGAVEVARTQQARLSEYRVLEALRRLDRGGADDDARATRLAELASFLVESGVPLGRHPESATQQVSGRDVRRAGPSVDQEIDAASGNERGAT